jgi:Na+/proline symporter
LKAPYDTYPAFQAMLSTFRDRGGFYAFISYVQLIAAIAAIMSTADSALIGVSNTISVDIFKNWLTPHYTQQQIVIIGKIISVITVIISIGVASYIYEQDVGYSLFFVHIHSHIHVLF